MNAPLTHFALTAAWLWLQLVALGAVYVARTRAAAIPTPPLTTLLTPPVNDPRPPASDDPKPPELIAIAQPSTPEKPPAVRPPPPVARPPVPLTDTTPPLMPPPRTPPASPKGPLPDGVDWSAGEVLLLVVGANFTTTERGLLRREVERVVADKPGAVVGGTAFVCDRGVAWGVASPDGPPGAEPFRTDQPAGFAEAFAQVATVEATVRQARGRPATVVVVWHGVRAPSLREFSATQRQLLPGKFAGTLVWSGAAIEADAVPDSVLRLFDARSISLHGRDLSGLAGTVANGLCLTPSTPREGDR